MLVDLRCVAEGMSCWNIDAINTYTERATTEELRQSCSFDVQVFPGRIACTGCVVDPESQMTSCSAQLTPTRVEIWGHPKETNDSISSIPDFQAIKPSTDRLA